MDVLRKMRDLLTPGAEEDLPPSEQIASKREEVRQEIEELEAELRRLRSDDGRRKALAEADSPEEVGRRRRRLRDRIDGLEQLDDELVRKQRKAKNAEMRAGLREAVEDLPDVADEFEAAMARQREARAAFESALSGVGEAVASLDHRGTAPEVALPEAQVDRLERLAGHLSGAHDFALDSLRPDDAEEPERRVIEDVQNQIRRFVGDWSGVDWREAVPPAPAGWTNDFSRATGIGEEQ